MSASSELRFEQYVLDRGLATEDELKEARRLLNRAEMDGTSISLPEALVRAGCLTHNQVQRVLGSLKEDTVSPRISIPGVQLLEKIGRGSQAVVYRGRQVSVDRAVAVKVLLSKTARDPVSRERFLQEVRAAAKLSHNNIVQAIDAGETDDGYVYFIMEIVDPPRTVADAIKDAGGALAEAEAVRIIIQIAEALAHAHSRGFIHRDVKPKNIMLTKDGVAKLADMGLARHITEGTFEEIGKAFGTPYYIAPEQVIGNPDIDFRADIYSLGATFYEMLTGRPPFTGKTPQLIMQKHVRAPLTPPDHLNSELSAGVSEIVEVMMSKRPSDRYKSTGDLLVDLKSVAAGGPPRIARERVGQHLGAIANLAQGEGVKAGEDRRRAPPPEHPFAVNQLTVILLVALAVAILINILQAVM
ncbi:MAG: serine/threonine protein kinase [Planctomycetes bacterium]|nr:serine/threonine protein kinase [Planctomycetota bacterium]